MNKYFLILLKAHLTFSFCFLAYYLLAVMSILLVSVEAFYKYMAHFAITFFYHLIIVGYGICKREKIVSILEELIRQVKESNSTRLRKLESRLTYVIYAMAIYNMLLCFLPYKTNEDYQHSVNPGQASLVTSARRLCFQCNVSQIPMWGLQTLFIMETIISTQSYFTICMWTSTMYIIFAVLLTELIGYLKNAILKMGLEQFSGEAFKVVQGQLKTIHDLTNSTNYVFQNLIFLWFACTLLSSCKIVVSVFDGYETLWNKWSASLLVFLCSAQNIVSLTVVIFVSSRVHDRASSCFALITSLAKDAILHGRESELELLFLHFRVRTMSLNAGGCFPISKKLYLSFLGVGFTYAVVYLQLNQRALERIQMN